MMKFSLKYVVAAALATAAAMSATSASADVLAGTTANAGNSELVLFVRNINNPSVVYARGLGVTLDDIYTGAEVVASSYTGPVQDFAGDFVFPTIGPDANLSSFLSGGAASDFVWTVMSNDSIGTTGTVGNRRAVFAAAIDYPEDSVTQTSNNNLISGFSNWATVVTELNGNLPDGAGTSTATNGLWGQPGTSGEGAPNWFGVGPGNENVLGSAANFYFLANSGGAGTNQARFYQLADLVLSASGELSAVTSEVPLPAAAWMLISGVLGLVGVGRRRAAALV